MGKAYVINGGVVATPGNLYTRNIYAGNGRCPDGAIIRTSTDVWTILGAWTGCDGSQDRGRCKG